MGPFFAGRLADRILLAKEMLSLWQESLFWIAYSFFLPRLMSLHSAQHPVSWGDFTCFFLKSFFVKGQNQEVYFFPFYLLLFFLWQRVNSELKALWRSWVWHLSLGPACPICFYIYTTRDTLASFFQTCEAFGFGFRRAQMLRVLIKRWVVELKGSCFFGPDLFWDITYCYFFFTFSLAR